MPSTNPLLVLKSKFYLCLGDHIVASYKQLLGKDICKLNDNRPFIEQLYDQSDFALLAHGVEADPIFNFANQKALSLFEYDWQSFIQLPSRLSAETIAQEERQTLLDRVNKDGYVDDYCGVRIRSTGKRFKIERAEVFNLYGEQKQYVGQAAKINLLDVKML